LCWSFEIDVPPPVEPKFSAFWSRSLMPVDPEPTPKNTNPSANASASSTNTHLAWLRSR
jgi:hypothetical protein